MGNFIMGLFRQKAQTADKEPDEPEEDIVDEDNEYDDDVQDAANLALAMQQDDNTTNYELSLSCENLPKMDRLSLTDPIVIVYMEVEDEFKEIGKTEVIQNTLNPSFSTNFLIPYNPELNQKIRFEVYDIDNMNEINDLSKQQIIGYYECLLNDIIVSKGDNLTGRILPINNKGNPNLGKISIKAFESDIGLSKIWLKFGTEDFITRNFIKFTINGSTSNKEYFKIHESPRVRNTPKGCIFPRFSVNSNKFPDENANLKFEFFEIKKSSNKLLGELEITFESLLNSGNKKIDITRNNFKIGKLKVLEILKEKKNAFLNYIYEGYCIKVINAIDLSKKVAGERNNEVVDMVGEYKEALSKVGNLLSYYDDDVKMVTLGFGAKLLPYHNIISHCFAINNNFFSPIIEGYHEIFNQLEQTEKEIIKSGPVMFSELIEYSIELAKYFKEHDKKQYIVLLIASDGDLSDMTTTQELLEKASDLPLSVIAIGVGSSIFEVFDSLKRKRKHLRGTLQSYEKQVRSNFHYIKYNMVKDNQERLAHATFAELPKQFLEYMKLIGINLKKVNDPKNKRSKREIKSKLENRKKKNASRPHPVLNYLKPLEKIFIDRFKPLGFDMILVNKIVRHGIQANSFNLMIENIAKEENEILEKEKEPIKVAELCEENEYLDMNKKAKKEFLKADDLISKVDFDEENIIGQAVRQAVTLIENGADVAQSLKKKQRILPEMIHLFPKDSMPKKKTEEWFHMKNKTHTATQKLLKDIEVEESGYIKEMLPDCIGGGKSKIKPTKKPQKLAPLIPQQIMVSSQEKPDLLPQLELDKAEYDKYFGAETADCKNCLNCRSKPISIVFMNCGHMVVCEDCLSEVSEYCLICSSPILRAIKTLVDEEATLSKPSRMRNEELDQHFREDEEQGRMSIIQEDPISESIQGDTSRSSSLSSRGSYPINRNVVQNDNNDQSLEDELFDMIDVGMRMADKSRLQESFIEP